jgi:hypothetical protein
MVRGRQRWAAILVAAVLLPACGDDDPDAAGTTTTTASTTTTESAEAGGDTTSTVAPLPDEPPFSDDGASGSGCAPGAGDLPDGWWYGLVDGEVTDELRFDLACYYVGAAAEAEAASRGDEVNNDYYVVNENEQLRTVPVAGGATARCVEPEGADLVDCAPGDVGGEAVWLRVQDGEVDRILEQYAP